MSALIGYYNAMANDRDAAAQVATAQARQVQANTDEVKPLADSEIGLRQAQQSLTQQQANTVAPNSTSEIGLRTAQTGSTDAGTRQTLTGLLSLDQLAPGAGSRLDQALGLAGYAGQAGAGAATPAAGVGSSTPVADAATRVLYGPGSSILSMGQPQPVQRVAASPYRYAEGTSKVGTPAKGAATDTIHAMLSPGEAVLNRGATEHLGSGVIDHLNKLGMMRMAAQDEIKKHQAAIDGHSLGTAVKEASQRMKTAAGAGKAKRAGGSKAA